MKASERTKITMKKTKWRVTYWHDYLDKEVIVGFHSYEEAVTFQHRLMKRFNRSSEIKLR